MKLDRNYFNSIELEPVKKKYYSLTDVDKILVDIRKNALEMVEEIENLESQLAVKDGELEKLSEKAEEGKLLYDQIIQKAKDQAAVIITDAQKEAEELRSQMNSEKENLEEYKAQKENEIINKIADAYEQMKKEHEDCIAEINSQWQNFLANMEMTESEPADIDDKVRKIAEEIAAISSDLDLDTDTVPAAEEAETEEHIPKQKKASKKKSGGKTAKAKQPSKKAKAIKLELETDEEAQKEEEMQRDMLEELLAAIEDSSDKSSFRDERRLAIAKKMATRKK